MAIELVEPTKLGVWFLSKWSTSSQDQKVPKISQINDFRVADQFGWINHHPFANLVAGLCSALISIYQFLNLRVRAGGRRAREGLHRQTKIWWITARRSDVRHFENQKCVCICFYSFNYFPFMEYLQTVTVQYILKW